MGFEEFISWLLSTSPASKLMTSEDLRKPENSEIMGTTGDSKNGAEEQG